MRSLHLSASRWRKSCYSNSDGGGCVEASDDFADFVPVRDCKNPHGPMFAFAAHDWSSFVSAVRDAA